MKVVRKRHPESRIVTRLARVLHLPLIHHLLLLFALMAPQGAISSRKTQKFPHNVFHAIYLSMSPFHHLYLFFPLNFALWQIHIKYGHFQKTNTHNDYKKAFNPPSLLIDNCKTAKMKTGPVNA